MKGKLYDPVTETVWYTLRSCLLFLEFRYAACSEKLWMFVGLISASFAGLCIPAIVIVFGKLAEEFINFEVVKVHEERVQRGQSAALEPAGLRWYHDGNSTYYTRAVIGTTVDLALYTVILGFAQLLLGAIFTAALNYSAQRQVLKTRTQYVKAVLKQDMSWFDMRSPHKLSAKVFMLTNDIYEGLAEKLGMMVYTSVSALVGFVVAFIHGWFLSLILVAFVPIILIIAALGAKVTKCIKNAEIKSYMKSESLALDSLLNIRSVAAYQGYSEESKMYGCSLNMNQTVTTGLHSFKGLVAGVLWFFVYCTYAVGLYYGVKLAMSDVHSYSPPTLIIIFFGVQVGLMNLLQIPSYVKIMRRAKKSADKVFAIIDRKPMMDRVPEDVKEPLDFLPSVSFSNVRFSYPGRPEVEVLRGVTFSIPAGQLVAIVGPPGSGKTTCLRLMDGFYDPPQGTVRVSGVDIRHVTGAWLRARIAFVQQQTMLLGATVADAIRFGVAGSDADVTEVARLAGVHDTIEQMAKRYSTPLSANISDDVRKRLAIARALLSNPDILLLDSCFSSMSAEAEAILLNTIVEARPDCTLVVVTSRQKTLESASHIVVLESGVAVEEGSLLELLRQRQWLFQALRRAAEARSVDAVDEEEDDTIDEFEPAASELGSRQTETDITRRRVSSDLGVEDVGVLAALGRSARTEDKDVERPQWGSVLKLGARDWPLLATGAVAAALCGLSLPVYAALFGECLALISVNPSSDVDKRLHFYTKIFLIAGCLSGTSLIVQGYTMAAAGSRLTKRLRQTLFDALLHQEMAWFEKEENDVDSLLRLLRVDAADVQKASGQQLALVVQLWSVVWASALLSLYYSWQLGLLSLALAPLLLYALLHLARAASRRPFDELEELNKAEVMLRDALGAVRVVVSDCAQPLVAAQVTAELRRAHAAVAEALRSRPLSFGLALATPAFCYSVCAALGAHLFNNGLVSYEVVFRVLQSLMLGTMLASQMAALAPNVLRGEMAAARVMDVISKRSYAFGPNADFNAKWSMRGNIRFYKVSFRPGPPQLREFSLQLRDGQSVALVGPTGCGRSLPVPLLLRFYWPSSGTLLLDGRDVTQTSLATVRSQMALADGNAIFFRRSVADNIAYGCWDARADDVIAAAKEAGAHDFITGLPDGYNTVLDERVALTASQRLRLSLARAVLRDAPILLVENLRRVEDDDAEALVEAALRRACLGRTCVLSCQQPQCAAVRAAQWVCVMRAGAIAEQGPVAFLAASRSLYRRLCYSSAAD